MNGGGAKRAILLGEQHLHDHRLEDFVLDLPHLVLRQRGTRALLILDGLRYTLLPLRVEDVLAVYFGDWSVRSHGRTTDEAGRIGKEEDAYEGDEEEQPNPLGRRPHLLQHWTYSSDG